MRIVGLFSVIAAVPAILVAVVASVTLDRGLDRLFSQRTRALIENSLIVADAYLREHAQIVRADIIAMAIELARAKPLFDQNREQFQQFLTAQASMRGLPAAMLIDKDAQRHRAGRHRKSAQTFAMPAAGRARRRQRDRAAGGDAVLDTNYVAAVIKLRGYRQPICTSRACSIRACVAQLRATQARVSRIRRAAGAPVRRADRVRADVHGDRADRAAVGGLDRAQLRQPAGGADPPPDRRRQVVSTGNLYVQVPVRRSEGDLAQLGETFNRMTQELRTQRDDIMRARDLIDSRRRFTEAVLAGASAGVIGVDAEGRISILNRSAEQLIGRTEAEALGQPLTEIVPELAEHVRDRPHPACSGWCRAR